MLRRPLARKALAVLLAAAFLRFAPAWWCGRGARAWLDGDAGAHAALAEELVAFEARDDAQRRAPSGDRFAGEWALVTHQMIALGLAQIALAHPALAARYAPLAARSAIKSFQPEMRDFGTDAWRGEDGMASLEGAHGHAYLGYPALALGMARLVDPAFPADVARAHDALIAALERRLLASPTGLIDTYPGEAYPTDVAAVAAAIAVHARATGANHDAALGHWAEKVRAVQLDCASGLVVQRMDARDGARHDAPRGSGTGLAAYFASFADCGIAELLTDGLLRQRATFLGFGAIREFAAGYSGQGDVDSGPVVFGVSVAATGFALGPARALGREDEFISIYRTTSLFGMPLAFVAGQRFATGGPIGNALLLALLTCRPEAQR